MFTGLIEQVGNVNNIKKVNDGYLLDILTSIKFEDVKIGDSIAINGVCLTVEEINNHNVSFFCAKNTFNITNLKYIKVNDKVNIERALKLSSRLDGHILTGHVETVVEVLKIEKNLNTYNFKFKLPDYNLRKYMCSKGSIGVNRISLTIAFIENEYFEVIVIHHTLEKTNLKYLKEKNYVNIETDIMAKYVENMLKLNNTGKIDYNKLNEYGFL